MLIAAESLVAVAGLGGAAALVAGLGTPPVAAIAPLGLSSWVLPGVWLAGTVAVPSGAAALLAARRSPHAPDVVLLAAGALAVELVVQVPFIGPHPLQAVFGAAAVTLAALGSDARRRGWRRAADR
ncbi:hypothetical protein [uncultured Cellulomonas sp.]|uniref:hypothetical protein n=1 Tax=uncultured Cellulomonas sp. TaxID=189682 RepID=UPI00261966D5|nr:hypothetical protein [uncultured Cellulomonas sp.]